MTEALVPFWEDVSLASVETVQEAQLTIPWV